MVISSQSQYINRKCIDGCYWCFRRSIRASHQQRSGTSTLVVPTYTDEQSDSKVGQTSTGMTDLPMGYFKTTTYCSPENDYAYVWEGPDGVLRPGSPLAAKYRTKTGCTIPLKSPRPLGEAPVTWSTAPRSNIRCYHQAASEADKPSDSDDLSEAHIVCDAPKPCRETCLHEVNMGCRMHGLGTIRPYNKVTTMKPIQKDSI